MTNPILFKNAFLNIRGEEMRLMYFYKDRFFLESTNGTVGVVDAANFNDVQLDQLLGDKEQQQELEGDKEVLELLDGLLAAVKKQEEGSSHDT